MNRVTAHLISALVVILCCVESFSNAFENDTNYTNCTYDEDHFPPGLAPWTVLIKLSSHHTFLGALIDETTILATGQPFMEKKLKMLPFANYTIQIGAHSSHGDHRKEFVQIGNISYIKFHPHIPTNNLFWPSFKNDWALMYLKEPIQFIRGIGQICLPSETLIRKLMLSTFEFVEYLPDIFIQGTIELSSSQTSYYVSLRSNDTCQQVWLKYHVTRKFAYRNRVCGTISQASSDNSCIIRDTASVLPEENGKWIVIGFQNFHIHREDRDCGDETYVVYISLLMPEDLQWIHNDMKCGSLKFSCDNGTKCLDLKTVCDGKTHQCVDKSDQNSAYCNGLSKCEPNQFTCSSGLAAYCIPLINPENGTRARDCNGVKDCPGGEDEADELCALSVCNGIYIGIGTSALIISSLVIAIRYARRRKLRDLTEDDLIDFFDGERHLQTDDADSVDEPNTMSTHTYENIQIGSDTEDDQLINQSHDDSQVGFCTEVIRRRGYDASSDFNVLDETQCTLGDQIGEGSFGIVKKGFVHGKTAAIKCPNDSIRVDAFKVLLLELKIMKYIHDVSGDTGHPNIVRFIGADTSRVRYRSLYVALEFCENGNIEEYIDHNRARFERDICGPALVPLNGETRIGIYEYRMPSELALPTPYPLHSECLRTLLQWAAQIASGMDFLSDKVIHLDLAARNVLLDSNLMAKVGDFGLSRKIYKSFPYKIKRNDPLPFQWLALEVIQTGKCSQYADVWSYGVTLWELFSLCESPWIEVSCLRELATKLRAGERLRHPKYASLEIYKQMLACWNKQPHLRPTIAKLEEFFQSLLQ